jgi:exodeoxyribonuclease V gamma subunit
MIQLAFSHRHETLLATLAADLAAYRERRGPWAPLNLVLPNPCVKQFVLEGLAKGLGVVANHTTFYLDGFWRRNLPRTDPPLRLLERNALQGLLLALFQDQALLEDPALAPVKGYLAREPRGLKALQLAGEVARVFEAYLLNRPDWAGDWEGGGDTGSRAPAPLEAWQRRLWRELRERLRGAGKVERWLTFREYLDDPVFAQAPFPEAVFVFGLGPMAGVYHQALRRLGDRSRVWLYLWNPSREIWDDIREQWRNPLDGDDPFRLETTGHLALQRWGRPGREHIREVLQLVPTSQVRADWSAPEPATLLQHLQHSIITLGTEGAPALPPGTDGSLAIHACTSPRREAEAVASAVWQAILDGGGEVRFSDLAVVLPDAVKAEYLDHLRVAFAATRDIPWVLADEGPGLLRETVEAARLLLGLARTDLSRAQVVAALTHPAVRRRWADLPLEDLAEFCDRAGIVIRFGTGDTLGTDQEGGLWTWERGLRRAALGHFLGAGAPGAPEPPPALPVDGAAELGLFLRGLLEDLRHLAGSAPRPPREWVAVLRAFLQAYLGHPARRGTEAEAQALAQVIRALGRLGELELPGAARPDLAFREVLVLAEEQMAALVAEALGHLGRGVVVATHGSLRGVPFHTRFLMGLGEGVFPRTPAPAAMDLTRFRRRPGDISPPEQDRYLFLESVLSARHALVLSYVCRDALTREDLQPSPVILDLRDVLVPALGAPAWEGLFVRHPNHRHDLGYFPHLTGRPAELPQNHCPAALAEAEALFLGRSLRAAAGLVDLPADPARWRLSPQAAQGLEPWLGRRHPLAAPEPPGNIRLSLGQLRTWLQCQVQGGASVRLGLGEEAGEDPADLDQEPVAAPRPDLGALRKEALWEAVATGAGPGEAFDKVHRDAAEAARMPVGVLFRGTRAEAVGTVATWHGLLPAGARPVRHRLGPDRSGRRTPLATRSVPPLELDLEIGGRAVRVRLEGATEPVLDGWSLLLSREGVSARSGPSLKDRVSLLRAWMDHLVMAAAGLGTHHGAWILEAPGKAGRGGGAWRVAMPDCTPEEAKAQLGAWAAEALASRDWSLAPIEAVLEVLEDPSQGLEGWLQDARARDKHFATRYGPLPRAAMAEDLEVCADWEAMAARRLGGFPGWSRIWEAL